MKAKWSDLTRMEKRAMKAAQMAGNSGAWQYPGTMKKLVEHGLVEAIRWRHENGETYEFYRLTSSGIKLMQEQS